MIPIVWGWRPYYYRTIFSTYQTFRCTRCRGYAQWHIRKRIHCFHVFGIPVFPASGTRTVIQCGLCHATYNGRDVDLAASIQADNIVFKQK
ncbi:MAG: zinc-ribbon domain-containing protein [Thermomicrobiales bacterium]|nr:zinc-ribbon domain-containing protein [Thermomicrobiales bacterium]